jgi:hypothetical protein
MQLAQIMHSHEESQQRAVALQSEVDALKAAAFLHADEAQVGSFTHVAFLRLPTLLGFSRTSLLPIVTCLDFCYQTLH